MKKVTRFIWAIVCSITIGLVSGVRHFLIVNGRKDHERFVIITPNKRAFYEFCRSNELPPSKQLWIKNNDDIYKTYGLELSEKQIILLHEWYKIPDAQRVYEWVRT